MDNSGREHSRKKLRVLQHRSTRFEHVQLVPKPLPPPKPVNIFVQFWRWLHRVGD